MKPIYGLVGEFSSPEAFVAGLRRVREAGYIRLEIFMPYGVEEAIDLLPKRVSPIPRAMALGGLAGGTGGFALQLYAARDYPLNVGGRPLASWPMFVPVAFELMVLCAALTGVLAFFILAGFPRLEHPIFNDPRFARASQDRFFICLRSDDARYGRMMGDRLLTEAGATSVEEVRL